MSCHLTVAWVDAIETTARRNGWRGLVVAQCSSLPDVRWRATCPHVHRKFETAAACAEKLATQLEDQ